MLADVIDGFGFGHFEVMRMPFRTFMAYHRLLSVRQTNRQIASKFGM